ncbi:DUF6318 family protein [Cellulosimicrobium marinum]|nr:DUF6318 family protein [Cellulosimicrobium marinum]
MDQHDAEGAAAAAEYFLELYPYVMTTGDTAEWEAMTHEACGFCSDSIGQATRIVDEEASFEGGEIATTVITTYAQDDLTGLYPLDVQIDQEPMVIRDSSNAELFADDRTSDLYRVEMGIRDGTWVVFEVAGSPEA